MKKILKTLEVCVRIERGVAAIPDCGVRAKREFAIRLPCLFRIASNLVQVILN